MVTANAAKCKRRRIKAQLQGLCADCRHRPLVAGSTYYCAKCKEINRAKCYRFYLLKGKVYRRRRKLKEQQCI